MAGDAWGGGLFLKAMNWELVPARQVAVTPGRRGSIVLPPHARGMRIGLFGGTFDPPHAAHRAASLLAMHRLGLDRLWWLVTPGNPLKDIRGLAPLAERVAAARALAHHPRIDVSDFEADLGTNYTYGTISYLVRSCPGVRFVWIMGADNLRHFHRWQRWRDIAALVPDRGDRSARSEPLLDGGSRRSGAGLGANPGIGGKDAAGPKAAGLDLLARPQIAAIVDGAARSPRVAQAGQEAG